MARILIIEDEPAPLRLMSKVLADAGHEVRAAADGPQAIALGKAFQPDLLLSDWLLADQTGLEVALAVRDVVPGVRALFVTGFPPETMREQARQVSPWPVLEKPIDIDELVKAVDKALRSLAPRRTPAR